MTRQTRYLFFLLLLVLTLMTKNFVLCQDPDDPDDGSGDGDDSGEDDGEDEDDDDEDDDDDDGEEAGGEQFTYLHLQRANFSGQAGLWTATGLVTNGTVVTNGSSGCGASYLGGPNILDSTTEGAGFEMTHDYLPDHSSVYITLEIVFIGTWTGKKFTMKVGEEETSFTFNTALTTSTSNTCSGRGPMTLRIQSPHDGDELTVAFVKDSGTTDQFAIRNYQLQLVGSNTQSTKACLAGSDATGLGSNYCGCNAANKYKTNTGCQTCHSSCRTCKGPESSDCLSCAPGFAWSGDECIACDGSCETCTGYGPDECSSCYDSSFLYSDLSCQPTCSMKTIYFYGEQYCDMCTEDNTFDYDEESTEPLYYYPDDQMCKQICPEPYAAKKMGSSFVCVIPLNKTTIGEIRSTSETSSSGADAMNGAMAAGNLADSSNPGVISSGKLARQFEYTRFLDVKKSASLEVFYKAKRSVPGTVAIGPKLSNATRNSFPYSKIPPIFQRYNFHSLFLVNFWDAIMTFLILLAASILLYGLQLVAMKKLNKYWQYFRMVTLGVFGFLIGQFYNSYSDIVLYATFDFRTLVNSTSNAVAWVSFFIAIFFILLGFAIILLHGRLLRRYQKYKVSKDSDDEPAKKRFETFAKQYESVQLLFKDYKDLTFFTQSYLLLLTVRDLCFGLIMGLLFEHIIVQCSLLVLLNILTILYLVIKRPFINIFSVIQQAALELVLMLVNTCFLAMSILDYTNKGTKANRVLLGDIVMKAVFVTKFLPLITLVPMVYFIIRDAYRNYKAKKNAKPEEAKAEPETAALSPGDDKATPEQQQPQEQQAPEQQAAEQHCENVHSPNSEQKALLQDEKGEHTEPTKREEPVHHNQLDLQVNNNNNNNNKSETYQALSYHDTEFSDEFADDDGGINVMNMKIPQQIWKDSKAT